MAQRMARFYAVFQGYLVTANADGSIPIHSLVIARLKEVDEDLLRDVIDRANQVARDEYLAGMKS